MAAVTICSDFGAPPKIKSDTVSTVFPCISHEVTWVPVSPLSLPIGEVVSSADKVV